MKLIPFSGQNMLGIDLGSHAIKIVEMRFSFGKPRVLNAACMELDAWKITDRVEKQALYVAALKKMLKENDIRTTSAVIEIPANSGAFKITKAGGAAADGLQAGPGGAFEKRESETRSAQPLEGIGSDGKPDREILEAVEDRNVVMDRFQTVRAAGLTPVIADIDVFAVLNLYMLLEKPSWKDSILLLDIGASATNIAIISNGIVKVVRTVFRAGNNFTKAIQGGVNVTPPAAETLKKRYGLLKTRAMWKKAEGPKARAGEGKSQKEEPEDEQGALVYALLASQMNEVAVEATRTIACFTEKMADPGIRISKVALAGGSAEMPGLAEYLGAALDLPVEVFRPFRKLDLKALRDKSLAGLPGFAAAAGLALRRPEKHEKTLTWMNFLPEALTRKPNLVARYTAYSLGVSLLFTGCYGYSYLQERVDTQSLSVRAELAVVGMRMKQMKAEMKAKMTAEAPKPAAPVRYRPPAPRKFAYLRGMSVSGVFTDPKGVCVLLNCSSGSYEVRKGKLYDEAGKAVADVSAVVTKNSVILSGGDEKYEIRIPN